MKVTNYLKKDSYIKAILIFVAITAVNFLAFQTETSYILIAEPHYDIKPSVGLLAFYLIFLIFIVARAVKCKEEGANRQYNAILIAFASMTLVSFIAGGFTYPIFNAVCLNLKYLYELKFAVSEETSNWVYPYFVNMFFMWITVLACIIFPFSQKSGKISFRPSAKTITLMLSVMSVLVLINYGFAYEKYERWYPFETKEEWYAETSEDTFLSFITQEQRNVYASVRTGTDIKEAEKAIVEKGFVKEKVSYSEFLDGAELGYALSDYILELCPEDEEIYGCDIYCHTNTVVDSEGYYDDIVSCIIIFYDDNGIIKDKLFIPCVGSVYLNSVYQNYGHGEETKKWFESLKKGDDCEDSLIFIRGTDAYIIENEVTQDGRTVNTYRILLECCYPLETELSDFILGTAPDFTEYDFDIILKEENGKIISGTMDAEKGIMNNYDETPEEFHKEIK